MRRELNVRSFSLSQEPGITPLDKTANQAYNDATTLSSPPKPSLSLASSPMATSPLLVSPSVAGESPGVDIGSISVNLTTDVEQSTESDMVRLGSDYASVDDLASEMSPATPRERRSLVDQLTKTPSLPPKLSMSRVSCPNVKIHPSKMKDLSSLSAGPTNSCPLPVRDSPYAEVSLDAKSSSETINGKSRSDTVKSRPSDGVKNNIVYAEVEIGKGPENIPVSCPAAATVGTKSVSGYATVTLPLSDPHPQATSTMSLGSRLPLVASPAGQEQVYARANKLRHSTGGTDTDNCNYATPSKSKLSCSISLPVKSDLAPIADLSLPPSSIGSSNELTAGDCVYAQPLRTTCTEGVDLADSCGLEPPPSPQPDVPIKTPASFSLLNRQDA